MDVQCRRLERRSRRYRRTRSPKDRREWVQATRPCFRIYRPNAVVIQLQRVERVARQSHDSRAAVASQSRRSTGT